MAFTSGAAAPRGRRSPGQWDYLGSIETMFRSFPSSILAT